MLFMIDIEPDLFNMMVDLLLLGLFMFIGGVINNIFVKIIKVLSKIYFFYKHDLSNENYVVFRKFFD